MSSDRILVRPEQRDAFNQRVIIWRIIREIFGSWDNAAAFFGVHVTGNKRIRKKKLKRMMGTLVFDDLRKVGLGLPSITD